MEEANPWLDEPVLHKNIKAEKPKHKNKKLENVEKSPNYINTMDRHKYSELLNVLLEEFKTDLPEKSKKFALDNFDKEWLDSFYKDIENIKHDLKNSKLFPPQTSMIFLKYIFLLQQSL